jgi:hypothetical protein
LNTQNSPPPGTHAYTAVSPTTHVASGVVHGSPAIPPPSKVPHAASPDAVQSVNGGAPQYALRLHTACPVGAHTNDLFAYGAAFTHDANGGSQGCAAVPPSNAGHTTSLHANAKPASQFPVNDHTAGASGTAASGAVAFPPHAIAIT